MNNNVVNFLNYLCIKEVTSRVYLLPESYTWFDWAQYSAFYEFRYRKDGYSTILYRTLVF